MSTALTIVDPDEFYVAPPLPPVLACDTWKNNSELIRDGVVRLGYLRDTDRVLDPTWGAGGWWTDWQPAELVRHDKYTLDGVDFRELPYDDDTFDAVAFDPPYVCPGGKKTSTIKPMHARYGMSGLDFRTPKELQQIMNAGLAEAARTARRHVLMKCMTYVSGGELWDGVYETKKYADVCLGLKLEDHFDMRHSPGPQPKTNRDGSDRQQRHARRNYSTLLVFKV